MTEDNKDNIDAGKREVLRRIVASAAFTAPIVASFPISGLSIDMAMAQTTSSHGTPTQSGTFAVAS